MARTHRYNLQTSWTGNTGTGTSGYRGYERAFELRAAGKPTIVGSSEPAFRGDRSRWNPEELLVAAISACHQLWFLHLCSEAGIAVESYADEAEGTMEAEADGTATFTGIRLRPRVVVPSDVDATKIEQLHHAAHVKCVIAQSVRFPVECEGSVVYAGEPAAIR